MNSYTSPGIARPVAALTTHDAAILLAALHAEHHQGTLRPGPVVSVKRLPGGAEVFKCRVAVPHTGRDVDVWFTVYTY